MKFIDNLGATNVEFMPLDVRLHINLPLLREQKACLSDLQWEFMKAGDERADLLTGILHLMDALEDALDPPK